MAVLLLPLMMGEDGDADVGKVHNDAVNPR